MNEKATYIVMLGPPGAGKGTQASVLAERLGLIHISSGDLFRDHLSRQTELGILASSFMNKGELVPDDVTIAMVKERILRSDCARGAVLDGFPRTPTQAEALQELLSELGQRISCVPLIQVPDDRLVARLSGRWMSQSGRVYHEVNNPPRVAGFDDEDGSPLYQREDDKPETVKRRLQVYHQQTAPLIAWYQDKGLLHEVDGEQAIDDVTAEMLKVLKQ